MSFGGCFGRRWLGAAMGQTMREKMPFSFGSDDKFTFLALNSCFTETKRGEVQLSDGTWVLPKLPTSIDEQWIRWIGELRAERLKNADMILLRREPSKEKANLGTQHAGMYQRVMNTFWLLQLSGVVLHQGCAFAQGSFVSGQVNISQMGEGGDYLFSEGAPKLPVTAERLEEAAQMAVVLEAMIASETHGRFIRGIAAFRDGLEHQWGQNRLHQFVRSIEALIKPKKFGVTDQFKERGQILGIQSADSKTMLAECYEMRCEVEHVREYNGYLKGIYGEDGWLAVGILRTRQIEALASESYRRILTSATIRAHFESDDTLEAFWALSPNEQRKIWGLGIDVTGFKDDDENQEKRRQIRKRHT